MFTDTKGVTKSYTPAANAPAWIEIPKGQFKNKITNDSKTGLKHDRPISSKDKNSQKKNKADKHDDSNTEECVQEET